MKLAIVKHDSDVLHQETKSWDLNQNVDEYGPINLGPYSFSNLENLIQEMKDLMIKSNGIGLAAPQVGIDYAFFIMLVDNRLRACFNPKVLTSSENKVSFNEGCLSYPGLFVDIIRPEVVDVEYYDEKGNRILETLTGLEARVFQHEYDHLMGVCLVDNVSKLKFDIAVKKAIKKGYLNVATYKHRSTRKAT